MELETASSFDAWLHRGQEDREIWRTPGASDRLLRAFESEIAGPPHLVVPTLRILEGLDEEMWRSAKTGQPIPDLPRLVRFFSSPLALQVLRNCTIPNANAEAILTTLRRLLLTQALNTPIGLSPSDAQQDVVAALANHCFLNEYCYWQSAEETLSVDLLTENLRSARAENEPIDPYLFAILSCYAPPLSAFLADEIESLGDIPRLRRLIERTVHHPALEREVAAQIPALTPIEDSTSQAVKAMYEENPYPRWSRHERRQGVPFLAYLKSIGSESNLRAFGAPTKPSALIAGCGTGQHVLVFCDAFPDVSVTAIDISLSSLSYAKRSTDSLGLQVRYAQADIAELNQWPEQFDIIDSIGVLHHMADPVAGCRNLVSRLRPGGILRLGLYSSAARVAVRDAWRFVSELRLQPTVADIRKFRRELLKIHWGNPVFPSRMAPLVEAGDFYSTSACRDLVFHIREVQFSIRTIFELVDNLNLDLVGFEFSAPRLEQHYRSRFPDDSRIRSRENLLQFESENPGAFWELIRFVVQKRV